MRLQTIAITTVAAFALGTILGVKYEGNRRDALELAQQQANEAEREARRILVFNNELDRLRGENERTLNFGEAFLFKLLVERFVLFIQEMTHFFKDRNGIGRFHRKLAISHQFPEKLIHIGKIKIPGKNKVPRFPIVLPDYRVEVSDFVFPVCSIPQMPKI